MHCAGVSVGNVSIPCLMGVRKEGIFRRDDIEDPKPTGQWSKRTGDVLLRAAAFGIGA